MISLVIPVFNEADNVEPLFKEITAVVSKIDDYEIIFVNDGSRDATQDKIEALFKKDPAHVRGIQLRHNFGKAAALHAGFQLAEGEYIVTLDGDMQDDPAELPVFMAKLATGFDLVSGWKQHRKDGLIKNQSSKVFNLATNFISKAKLRDFNSGFKAYRADVAKGLNLYGELHRYIPVIASSQGWRVAEIPIEHRKRYSGHSKYGSLRFFHGALDLLTVLFITRFRARPLHLFGYIGLLSFASGFAIGCYLLYVKFVGGAPIGGRPLLLLGMMLVVMGVQIGVTGLVGEQIATMIHRQDPSYDIKKLLTQVENQTVNHATLSRTLKR